LTTNTPDEDNEHLDEQQCEQFLACNRRVTIMHINWDYDKCLCVCVCPQKLHDAIKSEGIHLQQDVHSQPAQPHYSNHPQQLCRRQEKLLASDNPAAAALVCSKVQRQQQLGWTDRVLAEKVRLCSSSCANFADINCC